MLTSMKNKKDLESDCNITFFKTCERLQKNKKTISYYIRKDLITPEKGVQGFSTFDITPSVTGDRF